MASLGICILLLLHYYLVSSLLVLQTNHSLDKHIVYRVCHVTLREMQSNYMTIVSVGEIDLSWKFIRAFHREIGSVVLTDDDGIIGSSLAILLICSNEQVLFNSLSSSVNTWLPEKFYIILLPSLYKNYVHIFKSLWNQHLITNVLLLAVDEPQRIVSYNPFLDEVFEEDVEVLDLNKRNIRKIMRQKMSNLYGYPVRIAMFATKLKAIRQSDGFYKGYDGVILSTVANHMNFTPIIRVPPDGHKYGWREPNGTFTGAIGEIHNGRVDAAFNSIFVKDYNGANIQFTTPVLFDQVCFVVPKALPKPHWKTIFLCFDKEIWIFLLATYWITLSIWFVVKKCNATPFEANLLGLDLYGIFLMIPLNKIPTLYSERIIILTSLIFGFVVSSSLQGTMVKFLSYQTYESDMHNVEELYRSDLPVLTGSRNLKHLFGTEENPITGLLNKLSYVENETDILGEISLKRNAATIGPKNNMEEKIATFHIKDNKILLHVIEECPTSYYLGYMVQKNSPFLEVFNYIINRLVEAGITNSWFIHAKPFRSLSDFHKNIKEPHAVFSMQNVIIAFLVLVAGYFLSLVAFLTEIIWHAYMLPNNSKGKTQL